MSDQGWKRTVLAVVAVVFMSLVADEAVSSAASLTAPALPSPSGVPKPVTDVTRALTSPTATPTVPAPAPTVTAPVKKVVAPVVKKVTTPTRTVTSPTGTVTAPVTKPVKKIVGGTTPAAPRSPSVGGIIAGGGNGPGSPSAGPVDQLLEPGGSTGGGPGAPGTAPFALFGSPAGAALGQGGGGRPGAGNGSGGVAAAEVAAFVASLRSCLMALPSQDRDFLIFRAGLDGGGVRSRSAIARALGIAPARGAAVERRALGRLRSAAAGGECGASGGAVFAAGLFLGPTFLGSPVVTLLGSAGGVDATGAKTAQTAPAGYGFGRSFGDTLRSLGDGNGAPGPLWAVAVILLFLFGSVAALMRETRRSI